MLADTKARELIQAFQAQHEKLAQLEKYGKYAPGLMALKKQALAAKRQMDLYPVIANFKVVDHDFQTLLDTLGVAIADSVSRRIKVATENPFFERRRKPHNKLKR